MKTVLFVPLLAVVLCCSVYVSCTAPHTQAHASVGDSIVWPKPQVFTQKLDHFNNDDRTWSQRYVVIDDYYKPGGPVFFFLAGEAPMEFFEFQEVSAVHWAQKFGALYISLEHRFYGDSNPFEDVPYSTGNLHYLSSHQALADAENFLQSMKDTYKGKWVVFGCSYSGALSSWFRLLYSDSVVGSVAPSGPVEAQLNYTSYFGQFSRSADPACVQKAHQGSEIVLSMVNTADGRQKLGQMFNACEGTIAEEDVYYFLWTVMGAIGSADQMDNPPAWPLKKTCALLTRDGDVLTNYIDAFNFANGDSEADNSNESDVFDVAALKKVPTMGQEHKSALKMGGGANACTSFSESAYIESMTKADNANRSWFWQKCTEFGFFKGGYEGTSVFFPNVPVDPLVGYCERMFGIKGLAPDVDGTNKYYGAKDLAMTNIMFTNGALDPWHLLSITKANGHGVEATYYQDAGHCAPMTQPTDEDPPSLTQSRADVEAFLSRVLGITG
eukprot:GFYU01006072.1.p1 GENE.GFYU01006072.1~~GFYU01006072.1.p1  ORF type:complete len:498 (-),score=151.70 GFYU01006072.1:167-1660(-)